MNNCLKICLFLLVPFLTQQSDRASMANGLKMLCVLICFGAIVLDKATRINGKTHADDESDILLFQILRHFCVTFCFGFGAVPKYALLKFEITKKKEKQERPKKEHSIRTETERHSEGMTHLYQ